MSTGTDFDRRLARWLEDGVHSVPDWLVGRALDEAHATPQLGRGIRSPWVLPRVGGLKVAIVLGIMATALLAIASGAGSKPPGELAGEVPTMLPLESVTPCWGDEDAPVPLVVEDQIAIPETDLRVHLTPAPLSLLSAQSAARVIGFGDGVPGLGYGFVSSAEGDFVSSSARGIVIAVVTQAQSHGSLDGRPLGDTPEAFVVGLRDVAGFMVIGQAPANLAGRPAVRAHVSTVGLRDWKHIDARTRVGGLACVADFTLPSRITVLDVDGALVVVQVWAATDEGLQSWIGKADALLQQVGLSRS